jgi:hypothetical protein
LFPVVYPMAYPIAYPIAVYQTAAIGLAMDKLLD